MKNVAVYWDFENIHASLCARANGPSWYRGNVFTKQPHLVDINSIMQYVAELGNVNINKAYANWSFLYAYSFDLQNFAVDLIQLFPRGRYGKNGADIRMSIEILEDLAINSHIDIVVLIGGDSDYIAVAQKVRQKGKTIIGIGVQETTNQYWVKSCNEFKYYSSLLVKSSKIENLEAEGYEIEDMDKAKTLLKKAIKAAASGSGNDFVLKAALKPLMQRFDPSFDESNYGFKSFSEFLSACSDVVDIVQGKHDHVIALKGVNQVAIGDAITGNANQYEEVLKKQGIRLVDPKLLDLSLEETFNILHGQEINTIDFRRTLKEKVSKRDDKFTDTDATKVRAILYKAMVFRYMDNNKTTFVSGIDSIEDLRHRVRFTLVKRVLDNTPDEDPNMAMFAELLFGDPNRMDEVRRLITEYNKVE